MPFSDMRRLLLPRSLRRQFILAVAGLALLILAGGVTAVYALRIATSATQRLTSEQLLRMQEAQDLVKSTLLIERESYQLENTESVDAMRGSYANIVKQLAVFDRLSDQLVDADDDIDVLDLHQSSQLFRNTANIVAQLRESQLQAAVAHTQLRGSHTSLQQQTGSMEKSGPQFRDALRRQAGAMVASAQLQSDRFTRNFRDSVQELAKTSARNQRWVMLLLAGSLLFAWLVMHGFLGKHVLSRLQLVSRGLRLNDIGDGYPLVPVEGNDEISEMARAVEQFQEDRRQLALTNTALQVEKIRQEELIRKLAEAHSQLLQSEKMASIGQLAAGVAHEINNPVAFVNSNLSTLQRYVADLFKALWAYEKSEVEMTPETQTAIAELKRAIDIAYVHEDVTSLLLESMEGLQRVTRIVQGLKDFSHVDAMEKQWANLEKGLDSTINVVWSELKYKAELIKEYDAIPDIECIPSQLNQVFMNLLINAAQAIEEHGRITLRTGQDEQSVWVEVEDTGKGINPEHLARIFDPFFTTKPIGTGTGLGLSISYGIVKQQGGRIDVKSIVGKGSIFRVVLPRHAVLA